MRLLRAIKEAQAVGFTLAEIGEYLRASRRSTAPSEILRVRMAAKIDEIDGRIAGLRRMRDELARVVGCACDSLDHCTCGAAYLARSGREADAPPTVLHVTNGESAANTLRRTALGGAVLSWQDVLHAGPVPSVPRPELLRRRAGFLSDCGWGSRRAILASLERRDRQLERAFADGCRSSSGSSTTCTTSSSSSTCLPSLSRPDASPSAIRRRLVSRQAGVPRPRRADRGGARDPLARPAGSHRETRWRRR